MTKIGWAMVIFGSAVAVLGLSVGVIECWRVRRIARLMRQAPMSTTPPTVTELKRPHWETWRMEIGRSDTLTPYTQPREDE